VVTGERKGQQEDIDKAKKGSGYECDRLLEQAKRAGGNTSLALTTSLTSNGMAGAVSSHAA